MSRDLEFSVEKFSQFDAPWPHAHRWAIDQMPCPAYCCDLDGSIVHCNDAAVRLWGRCPSADASTDPDSLADLCTLDGSSVLRAPFAAHDAATTECIARSADGQIRTVILHTKAVAGPDGVQVGAIRCLTDISEKRALRELERGAATARSDFLTMLAHELRNPLAPIMSVAALLRMRSADAKVATLACVVERQAKQLSRFIADLLDASRMDCLHRLHIQRRSCSLGAMLVLGLDMAEASVAARRQRLLVEGGDREATLCCDPERLAQALGNVLVNASAFTRDDGEIHMRVSTDNKILNIEVTDCGAGIAPEDLPHVFAPFKQQAVAPGRAPSGAGLGLTIAKGVCEAHGGTIDVSSEGLGKGAAVSIALPIVE